MHTSYLVQVVSCCTTRRQAALQYLTKLRWTPRLLCTPAQVRQMNTPYGTEDHVGFLAGQSKQTCIKLQYVINTQHKMLKAGTRTSAA